MPAALATAAADTAATRRQPGTAAPADKSAAGVREAAATTAPRTAKRTGTPIPLQITGRDLEILRAVHRYRYLRTGQVKRLLFPESTTLQSARRRLRKLAHPGWRYLIRIGRAGQAGATAPEAAFCLATAGADLLGSCGDELIPYPRGRSGGGPLYLEHALALSEFRLALELGLRADPDLRLHRFVHEEELKTHLRRGLSKDAYKLFHLFRHPRSGQEYVVHPDALIVLAAGETAAARRLFFLEIDRGSEALRLVADKVTGYRLLKESGAFRKFGDFADFLVLLVTNSERRADNLRKAFTDVPGEADVWIAHEAAIGKDTVLMEAVWRDHEGKWQALLR